MPPMPPMPPMLLVLLMLHAPAAAMPALTLASAAQLARAGACSAASVDPDATYLYQASAALSGLDGSLTKHALLADQSGRLTAAGPPLWNAAALLDARDPATRSIHTGQQQGGRLRTVPLEWTALDQPAQRLLSVAVDGSADAYGPSRLAYLRGVRRLEAGQQGGWFRRRATLLGATVAGAPLYVAPLTAAALDTGQEEFLAGHASRPAAVYLQANDGMLHAFDAAGGGELFAYMPQALQPQWPRLTGAGHADSPYVDGGLAAGNALVRGKWKTVLAGAMGSGAQGVFVLDISNPARFAQGDAALFEFTDADDPDIGNIFNAPAIARFRTGPAQIGDFVVVASGHNNQRADGEKRFNPAGPGVLFLLSLDKDPAAAWELNRNYYKFTLPAATAALANGLSQPALIADADGTVRLALAGDLQGRLWRLDFSAGTAPWPRAGSDGVPLFSATDAGGRRQPITTQARAVYRTGGMLVLFGTGRLLEPGDAEDRSSQSFYAVADQPAETTLTRADLTSRSLASDSAGALRLDGAGVGDVGGAGWLLDFAVAGERIITSPSVRDGVLYIATMRPGAAACAPAGSLYLLDAQSGLQPEGITKPWLALPAQPGRALNIVPDRKPAPAGRAGAPGPASARNTVLEETPGGRPGLSILQKSHAGRLGWREVVDWEAMRNAASRK